MPYIAVLSADGSEFARIGPYVARRGALVDSKTLLLLRTKSEGGTVRPVTNARGQEVGYVAETDAGVQLKAKTQTGTGTARKTNKGRKTNGRAADVWTGAKRRAGRVVTSGARLSTLPLRAAWEHPYATTAGLSLLGPEGTAAGVTLLGAQAVLRAGAARDRAARGQRNPRRHKVTRADKAVARLAEVIARGIVVHLPHGSVGPYHKAVGAPSFALFVDAGAGYRMVQGMWEYPTATTAADHTVTKYGVGNVIDAVKRAAAKHGGQYTNLDTPVFAQRNPRGNCRNPVDNSVASYLKSMRIAAKNYKARGSSSELINVQTLGSEVMNRWDATPKQRGEANRIIDETAYLARHGRFR